MQLEHSITKIDDFVGCHIQVIAFGASYVGTLEEVNNKEGYLILSDGADKVTLDLEHVKSYCLIDPTKKS